MQHADQAAKFLERDLLRGELLLEPIAQVVETAFAVEPVEEVELFLLKAEVIQTDRILDDPVLPPLIALLGDLQIRPAANRQRPGGTGNQAVGKGGHEAIVDAKR